MVGQARDEEEGEEVVVGCVEEVKRESKKKKWLAVSKERIVPESNSSHVQFCCISKLVSK